MRFRTTLILAVLLAGLGAYLYFVEFERLAEEAKKKTLLEFKTEDVVAITLTYPDRKIALKFTDGKWRLVEPVHDLADETTVTNLLRAIAECEIKKTLEDVPSDLAPFGLDKPGAEIHVALTERELPVIKVGKTTPVGFSTYIQRADDPKVHLTSSAFHSGTDKQVKDLRDKQIVKFEDSDIRTIALHGVDHDILLVKTDTSWSLEQPATYAADAATVRSFLSTLRSMRATDFAAEEAADLAPFGLAQPRLTITLTPDKEDEQKRILVGSENDKKDLYVKVAARPTIYVVGSWVFRDLNKTANDFRDKTVVAFDPEAVTTVTVERGDGERFTLTRGENRVWALEGSETAPEESVVTRFLDDLKDLKAHEIASDTAEDLAPYGLASPQLRVAVGGTDGTV
ncbi:MAG: hypothetical protein A3J75_00450, partial [Acidobacteria bacterium RBG_16_68_9]